MNVVNAVNVELDLAECCDRAEALFVEEAGLNREGEKYQRMREAAFGIRGEIEDRVQVKGSYYFYDSFRLEGQVLTIGGTPGEMPDCAPGEVQLTCNAFEQIDPASVEGVYAYGVSAGDFYLEDRPLIDQVYADIWGTAFTDAIRAMIVDKIRVECRADGLDVSDSFGPGFYGMDTAEMHKMPLLVDFVGLGLELRESGVILPLKSCAGILLKVNGGYRALNSACELCLGSKRTCSLCSVRRHLI